MFHTCLIIFFHTDIIVHKNRYVRLTVYTDLHILLLYDRELWRFYCFVSTAISLVCSSSVLVNIDFPQIVTSPVTIN